MKLCYLFLAVLSCLLNVVLTSNYGRFEGKDMPQGTNNECFEEFLANTPSLLKNFQTQTLDCTTRATRHEDNYLAELSIFKSEEAGKVKDLHENFKSCNLEKGNSDYFECLRNFDSRSRQVLDEIKAQSKTLASRLSKLEHERTSCLSQIVEVNSFGVRDSFSDLQQCLSKTDDSSSKSPQITSSSSSSESPELDQLKKIYETLKACARNLDRSKFEMFDDCWRKIKIDEGLKNYLEKNAANFFDELTELDHKEDSCMRPFITKYVFPSQNLGFNLDKCLTEGLSKALYKDNGDKIVIKEYSELHKRLLSCRVNLNASAIEPCISDVLTNSEDVSDILYYSHSMKENYLKQIHEQISKTLINEDTCMGYVFERLQYKGLFMKASVKQSLKECLAKNYVSSQSPASADDVILKLISIEKYVKWCTQKMTGPELSQCIADRVAAQSTSLNYIASSPLYEKEYKMKILHRDMMGLCCFSTLITANQAKSYSTVENCMRNSAFY